MRITFVLPHAGLAGGVRVVAVLASRLQQRGHRLQVISTPPPDMPLRWKLRMLLTGRGWPAPPRAGEPSHFDGVDVPHRVLERWRPVTDADVPDADVVVATWWETAEWVAALSASKGAKVHFIQHDERMMYGPDQAHLQARSDATWRLPMYKIVSSAWLADLARQRCPRMPVSIVHNGVDMSRFHAPLRGRQARPTVGLLYSTVPFKGCDISLKALERAARKVPDLHVVAFGARPVDPALPLPPGSDFTCQPAQDAIRHIYARCDVWLCGSRGEGFHLPPLEAMACRCPVVSTRVGGPMDIIQDGVNGFLVPVEDVDALADRLVRVLSLSPAQWQRMSDAAHATALRCTWDQAAERVEQALQAAVAHNLQAR